MHCADHRRNMLWLRQLCRGGAGRLGCLLVLAGLVSGCSFYAAGRTLIDYPRETLECITECPSYTQPVVLHHPDTGASVECGPYPYAVHSGMAAAYRLERRQCVERYQRQGYQRLASGQQPPGK